MQTRRLGNTDLYPTVIGFGGVVVMKEDQADANRMVAEAFDAGIRYFDVAPQYQDAQQRLGPALAPYRDQVMLACKTLERTADGARAELEDSLTKLRTAARDAEAELTRLSDKKAALMEKLKDPDFYRDRPDEARELQQAMGHLQKDLDAAETKWLAGQEALEAATGQGA